MKRMFKLSGFIAIVALFSACFSPWAGDPGVVTIDFGDGGNAGEQGNAARRAVTPEEIPTLTHIITLYGNGTPVTARLVGAGTVSISVRSGNWNIRVRAESPEPAQTLRALGFGQVRVVAGQSTSAAVYMVSATEVANHAQLAAAISSARTDGLEKIIVLTQDIVVTSQLTIGTNRHIILASDEDVAIRRAAGFNPAAEMFVMQGNATLSLDRHGINGSVYVQGATDVVLPPPPIAIATVWVAGGTFQLGSELGTAFAVDTEPVTQVTLTGFNIGRFPVTQDQFYAVMGFNPSHFSDNPASGEVQGRRPVEAVNWYGAIVFSNRLSIMRGLTPAYVIPGIEYSSNPAWWMALTQEAIPTTNNPTWNAVQIVPGSSGYRLPTEAQWEFAAKGGQAQSSFTFSGSDTVAAVAWHDANSEGMTREVGRLAANQLGIHDMSGNLWEWVWDWYDQYPGTNQTDPTGAISGAYRVARGGGWSSAANTTRLVFRNPLPPTNLNRYIGFRVSRP